MCWDDIAATLLKDFLAKFGKITVRTLRERATNLMEAFLSADVRQRKQSGTEEEFKEKEQLRSLCARNLTTIEKTLTLNWPWNGPNNSTNKAPHAQVGSASAQLQNPLEDRHLQAKQQGTCPENDTTSHKETPRLSWQ